MKNDKNTRFPLIEEEVIFKQKVALFPREILEPLYEEYIRANPPYDMTRQQTQGFFRFLLEQSKDDTDKPTT